MSRKVRKEGFEEDIGTPVKNYDEQDSSWPCRKL